MLIIIIMLTIVIGLPGSGKTFFSNTLGIKVFDDFIFNFYSGELLNDIENNIDVCINDPRLCNYTIFQRYMKIFEKRIDKNNIQLYLFENDPDKCKQNANKNVNDFIDNYTKIYNLDNYKSYNTTILTSFYPMVL